MVYIQQFEAAKKIDFNNIIRQTVKQFEKQITEMNKSQLEEKGINSKGVKLPDYAASTVRIKRRKGQISGHMTLKDTGKFHNGFYVLAFMNFWEQGSRDLKATMLEKRYDSIFGLTEENLNKLMWQMGFVEKLKQNYINAI